MDGLLGGVGMSKLKGGKSCQEVMDVVLRYMERHGISTYAMVFRDPDDNSMFMAGGGDNIWRRGAVATLGDLVDDDALDGILVREGDR